jgi:asparagine synthase (glutamine-hydrolysing)
MCGLTGIFDSRERRPVDAALLEHMTDQLIHRGPDGGGLHLEAGLGLGHRRLAIIDLAAGQQPMTSQDGKLILVFNGEIYNFRTLTDELKLAGHQFRTHSDSEVILHGWRQWGADCVQHFAGMFAFALWDQEQEILMLARDHLGKKPLYWARRTDGMMFFASELKALTGIPGLDLTLDARSIEDYFAYGYVPDPRSIYLGIHKLPPAHRMIWRRGQPEARPEPYWDIAFQPTQAEPAEKQAEHLRASLAAATETRMIADVPLGAFLSGGVDSSAVVAMMAQAAGAEASPTQTFAIGFTDPTYDESAYARRIAERYHTLHHSAIADAFDLSLIDLLAGIYDEPFGDSSAMPTLLVCQLARRSVTVALSGDGGDEVFAGYRRQALHLRMEGLRRALPAGLRRALFGGLAEIAPKADWAPRWLRAKTSLMELAGDSAGAYFQAVSCLNDPARERLFSRSFHRSLQGYRAADLLREHIARAATDDPLQQVQYADLKTWLAGGILVKVDRASMANSLEVRSPFLDYRLVQWGLNLPTGAKLDNGEGKALLKKAMAPFIDRDLLYRRKQGFSMPLARWFRGPLRQRISALAASERLGDSGFFAMAQIKTMVDQHVSGRSDQSVGLWLLLMFESFLAGPGKN